MKIQCIMKYVHVGIYVYYVMWLHADTHVLCNIHEDMHVLCITYTWRYQVAVQRKVLDEVEEQLDIEADKDINNAEPPKSQMSLHHTVSQFMTIWTNGWILFCAAKGSWTCCWRNANLFPASRSDSLPRERVRTLRPRGGGVASFIGRFLRVHQWHWHWHWHWHRLQ